MKLQGKESALRYGLFSSTALGYLGLGIKKYIAEFIHCWIFCLFFWFGAKKIGSRVEVLARVLLK